MTRDIYEFLWQENTIPNQILIKFMWTGALPSSEYWSRCTLLKLSSRLQYATGVPLVAFYACFLSQCIRHTASVFLYCYVITFHFKAQEILMLFLRIDTTFFFFFFFDSSERRNTVKCKFTIPSWLEWALLFLPVCLKKYLWNSTY